MLDPAMVTPHWSIVPSPSVSTVSFLASSTNSSQVAGGVVMPAASNIFVL